MSIDAKSLGLVAAGAIAGAIGAALVARSSAKADAGAGAPGPSEPAAAAPAAPAASGGAGKAPRVLGGLPSTATADPRMFDMEGAELDASGLHAERLPIVIGIGGASGSGKSTVGECVRDKLPHVVIASISCDSYYKTKPDSCEAKDYNFDDPVALEFDLLAQHLRRLKQGRPIEVPCYDFKTHKRHPTKTTRIENAEVVIVDGIFALCVPHVRDACDLLIFTNEASDICLSRRLRRDIVERGRTIDSVLLQYERFVRPAFHRFIRPSMEHADLIIPRGRDNVHAIDLLARDVAHQVTHFRHLRRATFIKTGGSRGEGPLTPILDGTEVMVEEEDDEDAASSGGEADVDADDA